MEIKQSCFVWDVGNTSVKEGHFIGGELSSFTRKETELTLESVLEKINENPQSLGIVMASGDLNDTFGTLNHERILVMNAKTALPIKVDYETPLTLGLDRKANAVAASHHDNALVIDLGTCVTYDWILNGVYKGGAISPGWNMRLKAMHHQTAALPLLDAQYLTQSVGKSTGESMLLGAQLGLIGELNAFVERYMHEASEELSVYITGGDASYFEGALKCPIFVDPYLTLKGLHEILLHNLV